MTAKFFFSITLEIALTHRKIFLPYICRYMFSLSLQNHLFLPCAFFSNLLEEKDNLHIKLLRLYAFTCNYSQKVKILLLRSRLEKNQDSPPQENVPTINFHILFYLIINLIIYSLPQEEVITT